MITELISSKSCISPNAVQIRYWLLQSLPISIKLPTGGTVTAGFFFIATEIVLGIFMSANSNSEYEASETNEKVLKVIPNTMPKAVLKQQEGYFKAIYYTPIKYTSSNNYKVMCITN